MERITADMIADKEFSIESRGYNKDEVDTFLDLICEELDRLNNEIQDLRQKTTIVRPSAPAAESSGVSREDENKFREIENDDDFGTVEEVILTNNNKPEIAKKQKALEKATGLF